MSESILNSDNTLMDAVQLIENSVKRLAIVLSEDKHVVGTLTDGDIRRCLLRGCTLDTLATEAMNYSPVIASVNASDNTLRKLLDKNNIRSLPLVDANDCYVRTFHEMEFFYDTSEAQTEKTFSAAIIMAGGEGTRLRPFTENLPKPMIEINGIPLLERQVRCLAKMGMTTIYISVNYLSEIIKEHFGDGSNFGINLTYAVQPSPDGLAQAFIIGEEFIGDDNVCLVLGDNIFWGQGFTTILKRAVEKKNGATVFGYQVNDPERFGVVEFDSNKNAVSLEEKPKKPKSNFAVTGLYFYDNSVIEMAKRVKPSDRGELEITTLNQMYLEQGNLSVETLGRGFAWLDTGTYESLLEAAMFVETIEKRQGYKIACLEEIAFNQGWLTVDEVKSSASVLRKNSYG